MNNNTFLLSVGSADRLWEVAEPMPAFVRNDVLHAVPGNRWVTFPLRVKAGTVVPGWVRDLLINYTDYLVWSAQVLGQVIQDVQAYVNEARPTYVYVSTLPNGYCLLGNYDQMCGSGVPLVGIMPPGGVSRPTSPDTFIGDPRWVIGNANDGVLAQDAIGHLEGEDRYLTLLTRYVNGKPIQTDRVIAGTQAVKAACKMMGI